jgi:RNA recognition motif-containing protein
VKFPVKIDNLPPSVDAD